MSEYLESLFKDYKAFKDFIDNIDGEYINEKTSNLVDEVQEWSDLRIIELIERLQEVLLK